MLQEVGKPSLPQSEKDKKGKQKSKTKRKDEGHRSKDTGSPTQSQALPDHFGVGLRDHNSEAFQPGRKRRKSQRRNPQVEPSVLKHAVMCKNEQ